MDAPMLITITALVVSAIVMSVPLFLYLIWCDLQLSRIALQNLTDAVITDMKAGVPALPNGTKVMIQSKGN
jgi:hypothetical protein